MSKVKLLFAALGVGLLVSMVGAAIAALSVKRKIVPIDAPDADEVRLAAIFDSVMFKSTATAFRGGQVDLWFGGGVIDLRQATLDPAGARLEVRAVFGGCELLVPATWQVTTNVTGIGGAGDGRPNDDRLVGAPRLTVEGSVFFGGFGITSKLPDEAERAIQQEIEQKLGGPF